MVNALIRELYGKRILGKMKARGKKGKMMLFTYNLLPEDTVDTCLACKKNCKQRKVPRLVFQCFEYEKEEK